MDQERMETQLLREPDIYPTNEVLADALKDSYPAFKELFDEITAPDIGLVPEWRYYNDGKAWLCKVVYRKKTVFWLSVWDGYFRTAFYFMERHIAGIMALDIDPGIKSDFSSRESIGKLLPLIIRVNATGQVADILALAGLKKGLK